MAFSAGRGAGGDLCTRGGERCSEGRFSDGWGTWIRVRRRGGRAEWSGGLKIDGLWVNLIFLGNGWRFVAISGVYFWGTYFQVGGVLVGQLSRVRFRFRVAKY